MEGRWGTSDRDPLWRGGGERVTEIRCGGEVGNER